MARSCLSVFAISFSEAVIEAMVTGIRCGANKSPSTPDTGNRKTKKPAYLLALIIGPDWSVREDSNLRPLAPRTYQKKTGIYTGEDKWYGVANVAMMPKK